MTIDEPASRPTFSAIVQDTGYVELRFASGRKGRFVMRGGICWPIPLAQGRIQGAAVLAGLHEKDGVVYCFEDCAYTSIDPSMHHAELHAVGPFFNVAWSRYFSRKWFYQQPDHIADAYRRMVRTSSMIAPRPLFLKAHWETPDVALALIGQMLADGRLKYSAGGALDVAMRQTLSGAILPTGLSPHVHALACVVAGFLGRTYRAAYEDHHLYD